MPMVAIRLSPASRARSSAPSSHMSRWQWVSTIDAWEERIDLLDVSALPLAEVREFASRLTESGQELVGGDGDPGIQQERGHTQALGQRVKDGVEPLRVRLVLRELPRLLACDVCVERADALPHGFERTRDVDVVQPSADVVVDARERVGQGDGALGPRHLSVAVAV